MGNAHITVTKGAATQYMTARLGPDRIFLWLVLIRILSIPAPFVNVSAHVVHAKGVRLLRADSLGVIMGSRAV